MKSESKSVSAIGGFLILTQELYYRTTWNELERPGTNWNEVEPATNWHIKKRKKKLIRGYCARITIAQQNVPFAIIISVDPRYLELARVLNKFAGPLAIYAFTVHFHQNHLVISNLDISNISFSRSKFWVPWLRFFCFFKLFLKFVTCNIAALIGPNWCIIFIWKAQIET